MMDSLYNFDAKSTKERAYKKFKSNYIIEADSPAAKEATSTDGENEAILAIKDMLELEGDWRAQWLANNADGGYVVRFDKPDFRPVIVTFRPTIGNSMTFSIQFGEDGNCDYFDDDTPPNEPIVEIARFVKDENGRFAAMAEQFREKSDEIEREAGTKAAEDEEAASQEQELMDIATQPSPDDVPPPPNEGGQLPMPEA